MRKYTYTRNAFANLHVMRFLTAQRTLDVRDTSLHSRRARYTHGKETQETHFETYMQSASVHTREAHEVCERLFACRPLHRRSNSLLTASGASSHVGLYIYMHVGLYIYMHVGLYIYMQSDSQHTAMSRRYRAPLYLHAPSLSTSLQYQVCDCM